MSQESKSKTDSGLDGLPADLSLALESTPKQPFPRSIKPMLATLVDKPFDNRSWSFEIKWDGYRALAFMHNGQVDLKSRNDKSFNEKFYSVLNALKSWNLEAVIDGEITVTTQKGISNFGALQNWRSEADGLLIFYTFDLLWLAGKDLTHLPLSTRRAILRNLIPAGSDVIRFSENLDGEGTEVFEAAVGLRLEGIIAKKNDSPYRPGDRSNEWLKIKARRRQEVVIGGYTKNEGSSKPFSSLLVGVFDGGQLKYTGKIGTGFNVKTQRELLAQFEPLVRQASPFSTVPDINSPSRFRPDPPNATATWLKPKLVCEVSFTEMTSDEVMRHPSFEGMRSDKNASEVVLEKELDTDTLTSSENHKGKGPLVPGGTTERRSLLNPTDASQVRNVDGHDLKLANLNKLYWPEDDITKRDLLNYYYQVAPYILPYLKGRPQSLNRHPNGIHGKQFYQKDVKGKVPDWIHTFAYYSEADQREKEFFICDDEASLLYLVSLGCIEISPWSSRAEEPDKPDWCVIDLDPDQNSFDEVIQVAKAVHKLLDFLEVPSYCKTSGATGLHIYIPLEAKYTYEESKEFARALVTHVQADMPEITSIERKVADRHGKMYLDFLQNRPQATIAAPYCVRPKPGAPVSMPLQWEEVAVGLRNTQFTIENAVVRIKSVGDIFKPVLGPGALLEPAIAKLKALR
jgi:bifunctional non-homologous end joining protein LigD